MSLTSYCADVYEKLINKCFPQEVATDILFAGERFRDELLEFIQTCVTKIGQNENITADCLQKEKERAIYNILKDHLKELQSPKDVMKNYRTTSNHPKSVNPLFTIFDTAFLLVKHLESDRNPDMSFKDLMMTRGSYGQFSDVIDRDEQKQLVQFFELMKLAVILFSSKLQMQFLITIVLRITEGGNKISKYSFGSGAKFETKCRILIFEEEAMKKPQKRMRYLPCTRKRQRCGKLSRHIENDAALSEQDYDMLEELCDKGSQEDLLLTASHPPLNYRSHCSIDLMVPVLWSEEQRQCCGKRMREELPEQHNCEIS